MFNKVVIILLSSIFLLQNGICQKNKDSIIYFPFIRVSTAIQSPQGDLEENYGVNSNIGLSVGWKNNKNKTFELNYNFIHSENVKNTSVLDHLTNNQGWIINQYGEENLFLMYHRGGLISLDIGKIYNVIGPNPNSGIFIKGGIGSMYHKIRIENQENLIPQLKKEYLKYYDRLTVGVLLKQYIGYQNMSNNKLVNFTIGIEIIEGFNKGMRDYQIDLMGPYTEDKFDIYFGLRAGWFFPVLRKNPNEFYYN
tara:strand:- start:2665 stop:3420 length:756 start_codon:yes stop_codon:yes gene_type:complete